VDSPIYLYEMLRRQGDAVARLALASGGRDFRLAVSECVDCSAKPQCAAWLEAGKRDSFADFCPNAGYVQRITAIAKP
jgi:hypothetical protein